MSEVSPSLWLVNDDPAQLLVQKRLLGRFAAVVREFSSPHELIAEARQSQTPRFLVSDFHMPGMTGFELSKWWCKDRPQARVLLISASHLSRDETELAETLPREQVKVLPSFRLPDLLATARDWFEAEQTTGALDAPSINRSAPQGSTELFDLDVIEKLHQLGGQSFVNRALRKFAEKTPQRLQLLADSLVSKNHPQIHHESHALKGSCGIIGAYRLAEASDLLERRAREGATWDEMAEAVKAAQECWLETQTALGTLLRGES